MSEDIQEIGEAFVTYFYQTFDSNREELLSLYQEHSMLTYETEQYQGAKDIVAKYCNLGATSIEHDPTSCAVQPTAGGGILVVVTGNMFIDGANDKPVKYSEVFNLFQVPDSAQYYILNDVFQFNYC